MRSATGSKVYTMPTMDARVGEAARHCVTGRGAFGVTPAGTLAEVRRLDLTPREVEELVESVTG